MLREIAIFTIGAAAGFAASNFLMKNRYKAMLDEEIKSVMDWVKTKTGETKEASTDEEKSEEEEKEDGEPAKEYNKIRDRMVEEGLIMNETKKPYIIEEADFVMDDDEYDKISLEYYTDSYALYEGGEYIPNVDEVVGQENIDLLVESMDDLMYVRNEGYKTDYEISKVIGRYSDWE